MEVNEAEELRSLRDENHRLKKLVADLSLDKEMLNATSTSGPPLETGKVVRFLSRSVLLRPSSAG